MKKDYRVLLDLFHEFDAFLRRIYGLYMDSVAGYDFLSKYIESEQQYYQKRFKNDKELYSLEFLDTMSFSHDRFVDGALGEISVHFGKKGDIKKRNKRNGENQCYMGSMCVVIFYTYWDTYFRKRLTTALGMKGKEFKSNIWGDLRLFRHCILHNKNIISPSDARNIKLLKWFKAGEEVIIDEDKFTTIFSSLLSFRNWVHNQSFKKTYITIPLKS